MTVQARIRLRPLNKVLANFHRQVKPAAATAGAERTESYGRAGNGLGSGLLQASGANGRASARELDTPRGRTLSAASLARRDMGP